MQRINIDSDSHALSDFSAGVGSYVQQVTETKKPLLITQLGKTIAVLADVGEYEDMQERLELLEDIYKAESQIEEGHGIPHQQAKSMVMKGIKA